MAEYGRNIQSLIEHLVKVKDEKKRDQYSRSCLKASLI